MQNHPEGEGDVSIECVQSSEFTVGKQTNFNGAVTIINCADALGGGEGGEGDAEQRREEKIVIRDRVLAPTAPSEADVSKKGGKLAGVKQGFEKWRNLGGKKLRMIAWMSVGLALLAAAAISLGVFFGEESTAETVIEGENCSHAFYSKEDWQGKAPKSIVKMKLPVPYVVVSHSVTPLCYNLKTCSSLLQNMQEYHFSLDFADIGYNFLIDSNGNIYEGRSWDRRNPKGGFVNGRNIDICLIGDYSDGIRPRQHLLDGLRHLLDFGLAEGKISPTYSLLAANSTYSTLSPGRNVYDVIKHWPHFDADPQTHIKEFDER